MAILLTLPIAYYDPRLPTITAILGAITAIPSLLYLLGQIALTPRWPRRILAYPLLMLLGIGITWSSTLAIVDGLLHWGGDFKRTPKFNLRGQRGTWQRTGYRIHVDLTTLGRVVHRHLRGAHHLGGRADARAGPTALQLDLSRRGNPDDLGDSLAGALRQAGQETRQEAMKRGKKKGGRIIRPPSKSLSRRVPNTFQKLRFHSIHRTSRRC